MTGLEGAILEDLVAFYHMKGWTIVGRPYRCHIYGADDAIWVELDCNTRDWRNTYHRFSPRDFLDFIYEARGWDR